MNGKLLTATALAALALIGCGGGDEPPHPAPQATSTHSFGDGWRDRVAEGPDVPAEAEPAKDDGATTLAWLREHFAGTAWIGHVRKVEWIGDAAWVTTDLSPDADAAVPASRICNAVSGYEITERGGFSGVRVAASDGQRLVWRRQLSDSCKARS